MPLWRELKRRDVFKVAIAYLVASWLIVQVVGVLTDPLNLPDELDTIVVVLLGIGFPFALIIAWIYEVTPHGVRVTADAHQENRASAQSQRLTYALVALFMLAAGLMAVNRILSDSPSNGFGTGSRLAILPCTDLSPDPTNAYFADGIHAELITRLGFLRGLDVVSRASVLRYADGLTPIPQIAEELDVPAVMECLVRYSGNRVRITAQVMDGATDGDLWGDIYRADLTNLDEIFEIQADIAMNVANALRVEFLSSERDQIEVAPTQSREAYELYLAAQALSEIDSAGRLPLLDEAITFDDTFVDAWFERSKANTYAAEYDRGWADAQRILDVSPDDGRAYVARGFNLMWQGQWIEAERNYRRALELGLDPTSVPNHAFLKMTVGLFDEARPGIEEYLLVNPMDHISASFLMMLYELLGDDDARQSAFDRGQRLYPIWPDRTDDALIRLAEGDHDRLRGLATIPLASGIRVHTPGISSLDSPDTGITALREFHAALDEESSGPRGNAQPLFFLSAWAAFYGDSELALEWLEEALTLTPIQLSRAWYPAFDSVRREPGFEQLLADLGLPEYWEIYGWPDFCRRISDEEFECD